MVYQTNTTNMKIRFILLLSILLGLTFSCKTDDSKQEVSQVQEIRQWKPEDTRSLTGILAERGLITKTDSAQEGYVLFEPTHSTKSFLINRDGQVVHEWNTNLYANQAYLLENGNIIRQEQNIDVTTFAFGGYYGKLREYDWDGNIVWEFNYADENHILHHDIEPLPNGNILAIAYEVVSQEEAIANGRNPETVTSAGLWVDKIIEIKPIKPKGGEIVWEWRMMDHLVQDFDPTKSNYGVVADSPNKIDINADITEDNGPMTEDEFKEAEEKGWNMKNQTFENLHSEQTHCNAVSYNPELDQIAFSFKYFCEIYIVDHSTSAQESKGNSGGRYGRGGDLLYRWGNPANYGRGTEEDQKLFSQHDLKFIPKGYPGEGNLLVFNNDIPNHESKYSSTFDAFGKVEINSPEINIHIADVGNYSAVYELKTPINKEGSYDLFEGNTFGPEAPVWEYIAPDKYSFFSAFVSGAQRLENGNTLITAGTVGRFFEVTPEKDIVWDYWNPYFFNYKLPDGTEPDPAGVFKYYQFRGTFFDKGFPAFNGKDLRPIEPQPEPFIFKMPPPPPTQENDSIQ